MHVRVVHTFGRRFVLVSAEADPNVPVPDAFRHLMGVCAEQLAGYGLSLENAVRTRLWARTREARDAASTQRRDLLGGGTRPASSSYIAPGHFLTDASVAVDLVAMEAPRTAERYHIELDPPISPPQFLLYDGMLFFSGVSAVAGTLKEAVDDCIPRIRASLERAGIGWSDVVRSAAFVQRQQSLDETRRLLVAAAAIATVPMRLESVDAYSAPGKQIEIEISATRRG